ncbi:MAG: hypothetical protein GY796_31005 [Chloroflexi bacterium]|nr:hypothetical protein [Chloroflexota bacterium]
MDEVLGLTLVLLATAVPLTALLVLLPFLIPNRVERTRRVLQTAPGHSFAIGLVNSIFFLIIAAIFSQGGDFGSLIALLILLALLTLSAIGLSSIVVILRERIYPGFENGLRDSMKTAVLLVSANLLPLVGWFVLAPILLVAGFGAGIMALAQRQKKQTPKI